MRESPLRTDSDRTNRGYDINTGKGMRILDLFSGAGGAAMGLHRAWPDAEIIGVDIKPQPRYPFTFVLGDAMTYPLDGFDFVWASPPCQSYSAAMRHLAIPQPMLIDAMRDRLMASTAAWVIENVVGAPLREPLVLCGTMFGLRIHRHRLFESPRLTAARPRCNVTKPILNPHNHESRLRIYAEFGRQDPEKLWGREMGVGWMNRHETREAIPPAYSEYIARQLP
jgi:DNA (cytosine-5)-methyltransferase 1